MRLSEMLLQGSQMLRPLRGVMKRGDEGCALGMIQQAGGRDALLPLYGEYGIETLPCGCDPSQRLMYGGGEFQKADLLQVRYAGVVTHLFNQHVCATEEEVGEGVVKWTIPQLAAWLDEVGPKDPEKPAEPEEPAVPDSQPEVPVEEKELVAV